MIDRSLTLLYVYIYQFLNGKLNKVNLTAISITQCSQSAVVQTKLMVQCSFLIKLLVTLVAFMYSTSLKIAIFIPDQSQNFPQPFCLSLSLQCLSVSIFMPSGNATLLQAYNQGLTSNDLRFSHKDLNRPDVWKDLVRHRKIWTDTKRVGQTDIQA